MSLRLLTSKSQVLTRPCVAQAAVLSRVRHASSNSNSTASKTQQDSKPSTGQSQNAQPQSTQPKHKKTMAELDEELRMKMSSHAGDGGEAGIEYEDGQPVSMKRSVKNNMFRYI